MTEDRNGGWIQTFSGRCFWPLDPRPEEVRLEDIAHALALCCRFGGHCREFYSVAEHSVRVARFLAGGGWGAGCQALGLLHDAGEAYLVDVPRPVKPSLPLLIEAEAAVERAVLERFGVEAEAVWRAGVKDADDVLLATERRDLMAAGALPWQPLPAPLLSAIEPWDWRKAEREFLAEAERLGLR